MNQNIAKLYQIADKESRIILGLMSGTSLDGLDLALCRFSGKNLNTKLELLNFITYPYSEAIKRKIREVFPQKEVRLQRICLLNSRLANVQARIILDVLQQWGVSPKDVDCIASHGQTIYHAPKRLHMKPHFTNSTLQIGDADHIAYKTGIITLSDFRQKHIAAGGEGAPLAVYGDYLLFSKKEYSRVFLNIGGIANFTYIPGSLAPEEVFATDTGPGNTLLDEVVRRYLPPMMYDVDGMIAQEGIVNQELLAGLKSHPFFLQSFPKTTGQELFNIHFVQEAQKNSNTLMLNPRDLIATLTQFTAETIVEGIKAVLSEREPVEFYISGGGVHNVNLIQRIEALFPKGKFYNFKTLGVPADAKEAVLFALLANQTLVGEGITLGKEGKIIPPVTMGKISFPT